MLSLIVAMDQNRCIGKGNDLPWPRLKKDMKHFRRMTKGHAVIMGRKTYDSIGKPLKNRMNIVMTRSNPGESQENLIYVKTPKEALQAAYKVDNEPFIIGGSQIYKILLPMVDIMHITTIEDIFEGDTYFPEYYDDWETISASNFGDMETVTYKNIEGYGISLSFDKLRRK
jgi:dihydrofolate reductase